MIVRILSTLRAAPDGIHVKVYEAGQECEFPDPLAEGLVRDKLAEKVEAEAVDVATHGADEPKAEAVQLETPKREYKPKGK